MLHVSLELSLSLSHTRTLRFLGSSDGPASMDDSRRVPSTVAGGEWERPFPFPFASAGFSASSFTGTAAAFAMTLKVAFSIVQALKYSHSRRAV